MPSPSQPAASQNPTQTQGLSAGMDMRELAKLIAGELADIVVERLTARIGSAPPELVNDSLTHDAAAKYLGTSSKSLYRYTSDGLIPYAEMRGGHRLYAKKDIDEAVLVLSKRTDPVQALRAKYRKNKPL